MDLASTGLSCSITSSVKPSDPAITDRITIQDSSSSNPLNGSGVGQVDGFFRNAAISVVSGTPFTLDLTSGTALKDLFGVAITAAHILGIKLTNSAPAGAGNGTLTIGGGTNGFVSYAVPVEPKGSFFIDAAQNGGLTMVVDSTHKIVQITASAGTIAGTLSLLVRSL